MSGRYLHFSLGPVQGFVAQARRTRDFQTGSFLLSWLSAHAMAAVEKAGGEIVMPDVEGDEMLARVKGGHGKGPCFGSLPNNFIAAVPEGVDGRVAADAVRQAWRRLADAVWTGDRLEEVVVSRELWEEQIEGFWEIQWLIAPEDDGRWLAMRKNRRTHMPPEQEGDKCTMMGEWQELSGVARPNRSEQRDFWARLRKAAGASLLDLRENERLCAPAFVKRRCVKHWERVDGHAGWSLPASAPSTAHLAAAHWLERVLQAADAPALQAFHDAARGLDVDYGEWTLDLKCVRQAAGSDALRKKVAALDARLFFDFELEKAENAALRGPMKALTKAAGGAPSPFYAILLMDGDNLGATKQAMAAQGGAKALSGALADFTRKVPGIVKEHSGFLVYAGGDDVLAMLPLEDALPCAAALRAAYMAVFRDREVPEGEYSISAAVVYAHLKLPLTMVLRDAHAVLDDVAKDATGRNALACRVWKPGGVQQTWAMPWPEALDSEGRVKMAELAEYLGRDASGDPGYANKLIYHLRDVLDMLDGAGDLDADDLRDMLVADYVRSGLLDRIKGRDARLARARSLIHPLLEQCRVFEAAREGARTLGRDSGRFSADGALLLRFLAQKGVER